jgi:hypothetical protein
VGGSRRRSICTRVAKGGVVQRELGLVGRQESSRLVGPALP